MGFTDAVSTCLREKYSTFSGRASRSEYWYFFLFMVFIPLGILITTAVLAGSLVNDIAKIEEQLNKILGVLVGLFCLVTLSPWLAVSTRRFHDVNLPGWLYLGSWALSIFPYFAFFLYSFAWGRPSPELIYNPPFWFSALTFFGQMLPFILLITTTAVFIVAILRGTAGENKYGFDPLSPPTAQEVFE